MISPLSNTLLAHYPARRGRQSERAAPRCSPSRRSASPVLISNHPSAPRQDLICQAEFCTLFGVLTSSDGINSSLGRLPCECHFVNHRFGFLHSFSGSSQD